jgi:hypothetical protein
MEEQMSNSDRPEFAPTGTNRFTALSGGKSIGTVEKVGKRWVALDRNLKRVGDYNSITEAGQALMEKK